MWQEYPLESHGALDRPTSGQVLLAGHDLAGLSDKEMAEVRRRDIGFIFQMHHLLDQCTVLENVLIPTLAEKNSAVPMKQRAEDLLAKVGLADRLNYRPVNSPVANDNVWPWHGP